MRAYDKGVFYEERSSKLYKTYKKHDYGKRKKACNLCAGKYCDNGACRGGRGWNKGTGYGNEWRRAEFYSCDSRNNYMLCLGSILLFAGIHSSDSACIYFRRRHCKSRRARRKHSRIHNFFSDNGRFGCGSNCYFKGNINKVICTYLRVNLKAGRAIRLARSFMPIFYSRPNRVSGNIFNLSEN